MLQRKKSGQKKLNHKNRSSLYLLLIFLLQIIICGIGLFKLDSFYAFSNGIGFINLLFIINLLISIAGIVFTAFVFTGAVASVNPKESADQLSSDEDNKKVISSELFSEFIKKTGSLTHTERIIFDHCLEGKSGKEITELLGISANTLKVHNNHIYKKLNISSREELSLYIDLITKSGMLSQIANKR